MEESGTESDDSLASDIDSDPDDIETFNYDPSDDEQVDVREWKKRIQRTRLLSRDIVTKKPGLTIHSENVSSIRESFDLFFSQEMKDIIIKYTNQRGNNRYGNEWKTLSSQEFDKFLGILIAMGANHDTKKSLNRIWQRTNIFHAPIYSKFMSRNRFSDIIRCLRFDDKEKRDAKKAEKRAGMNTDRQSAIREFNDMMRKSCMACMNPGSHLTIDKRMVSFRGNCNFRVYMKSKRDKYGLKIWMLVDVENNYVHNFDPYFGKIGANREKNQSQRLVMQLSDHLGAGYNITFDNFFTSFPLAHHLLKKQKTILGTLRCNKKGIPEHMLASKNRIVLSTDFVLTDRLSLASYVPKEEKAVLLLSSSQPDTRVDHDDKNKPFMIKEYNRTKAAVDLVDKVTKQYSCKRKSRRWTMAMFYNFLDISLLNSHIILQQKSNVKKNRMITMIE